MSRRVLNLFFLLSLVCQAWAAGSPGIWLDVPFVKQEKDGCVAASISMVLQYWNRDQSPRLSAQADPHAIQQALYSEDVDGIFATAMEPYLQAAGFLTFVFEGEWTDFSHHLSLGRPLIACLGASGSKRHCVVVVGGDWKQDFVFVNDPAQRKLLRMDRAEFEKHWNGTGKWTLLAVPKPGE